MRKPNTKEESNKSKEAAKKLQVLSVLIKEKAFARTIEILWNKLGHGGPTIVQNIKGLDKYEPKTMDRHWKTFTVKFRITDDGIFRLEETLKKYNDLKKMYRGRVDSLELLKTIENPTAERITRTMTFLNKCDIHEKVAFVGLAIYDEMMERKEFTVIAYCDKLRNLFTKLWPQQNFAISNQFKGTEFIDENQEIYKLNSIVQTNFNYLLMKQEYDRIKDIPYTTCFRNSFQRTDIETGSYWLEENSGRIWYVNDHVVRNGIDIYVMAIFEEYSTKCSEVYEFTFWDGDTVSVICLPQTLLGYYDYSLDGKSMEFSSDEGFNRHKLPTKLLRTGIENPAVKFLNEGMDEESINDAAQTYICDAITDVIISRQHLTVTTTNGTYTIEREKYPDIKNIHPDDEAYIMVLNEKEFIIFRGNYPLNIPLEDFEPLTNEEMIKELGLDK